MVETSSAAAYLPLYGKAGLYVSKRLVRLRRKSLAILYYLAVEGPVTRAALAELLWEHGSARQNLRVELHELRRALQPEGIVAFAGARDTLELPPGIALDPSGTGEALEGLEQISGSFDAWLQGLRARSSPSGAEPDEHLREQATELAREVSPPFLLIIKGSPLADYKSVAMQIASELKLPFIEGTEGGSLAVRYLPAPQSEEQVGRILAERKSIWILPTAPYGEDHSSLLKLRSRWPAERTRFVTLEPLSWLAARRGPLRERGFARAAQAYLCSGGDAGHLACLDKLSQGGRDELPLPQQVRAAYQHESRFLSHEARLALERLAAHPGCLTKELVVSLGAADHLDELERRGWLIYDEEWRFSAEAARRVLYQALQPGRRAEYHRRLADFFSELAKPVAAAYHLSCAYPKTRFGSDLEGLAPWGRVVRSQALEDSTAPALTRPAMPPAAEELIFEPPESLERGWVAYPEGYYFVRNGPPFQPGSLRFPAAEEDVLLRLRGRGWVENALGVGLNGDRLPLLVLSGREEMAALAPLRHEDSAAGVPLVPVQEFDVCFYLPAGRPLELRADPERAVIEVELSAYRWRGRERPEPGMLRAANQ